MKVATKSVKSVSSRSSKTKSSSKGSTPDSKQPSATATSERSHKEEHVYEKVTPRDFLRVDSWKDTSKGSVGKRWWRQKGKKDQRMTMVKLTVCFGAILVCILLLVAFGAYYIVKNREDFTSQLDERLTTKTALCRKQYPDLKDCITEDPKKYNECGASPMCYSIQWKFSVPLAFIKVEKIQRSPTDTIFVFSPLRLDDTEYADCGSDPGHWCQNGQCVPSDVPAEKWYRTAPFPDKVAKLVTRNVNDLPCFRVATEFKTIFDNLVSWYVGSCGKTSCEDYCNKSTCSVGPMVKYGLRVALYHCDLTMDQETGTRSWPCIRQSPLKLIKCHVCENYSDKDLSKQQMTVMAQKCINGSKSTECSFKCSPNDSQIHFMHDGMPCSVRSRSSEAGACLMGQCVSLHSES